MQPRYSSVKVSTPPKTAAFPTPLLAGTPPAFAEDPISTPAEGNSEVVFGLCAHRCGVSLRRCLGVSYHARGAGKAAASLEAKDHPPPLPSAHDDDNLEKGRENRPGTSAGRLPRYSTIACCRRCRGRVAFQPARRIAASTDAGVILTRWLVRCLVIGTCMT